jgi:hypothetical protein
MPLPCQRLVLMRIAQVAGDQLTWVDVSPISRCRICGAVRACAMLETGDFVLCRQIMSDWPMLGGGWLHRCLDRPPPDRKQEQEHAAVVL